MRLYKRENYLKKIRGFYRDTGLIKVITGIRRCGKSSLMATIAEELEEAGVDQENIIYLNLDKRGYRNVKTADRLDDPPSTARVVPSSRRIAPPRTSVSPALPDSACCLKFCS